MSTRHRHTISGTAILALAVVLLLSTTAQAITTLDRIFYRTATLRGNDKQILVNRLTGEVKSLRQDNGAWLPLSGKWKDMYQKMYDAQEKPNQPAITEDPVEFTDDNEESK